MDIDTLTTTFKLASQGLKMQNDLFPLVIKPVISTTKPMIKFIFKF